MKKISTQETPEVKNFKDAREIREFPFGRLECIEIGGILIGRTILQPGWRWTEAMKKLAKTSICEAPHFQYHVSGRVKFLMEDGTEFECGPGDVSLLPKGHDAWVVGNEAAVLVDFQGVYEFGKDRLIHF